jgi:hypothetical protein
MDVNIFATDDSFMVGMFAQFKCRWNKRDKSLSIWSDGGVIRTNITTNRGTFVEVLDQSGAVTSYGGDGNWMWVEVGKKSVTLRHKKLPPLNLSSAQLEKKKRSVTRYLVDDRPYSVGIPDTLAGAIKWLEKKRDAIPEASRTKARFRFDTTMEYGETYPHVEITYEERETDEEVTRRLQVEAERKRLADMGERAHFERLKSKFATGRD